MVEKGTKDDSNEDFLDASNYWEGLLNRCQNTRFWEKLMDNATLISRQNNEYDGSIGTTYALLSYANRVAVLAFPGVSTAANMESGVKGAFITWPGDNDSDKDVHELLLQ